MTGNLTIILAFPLGSVGASSQHASLEVVCFLTKQLVFSTESFLRDRHESPSLEVVIISHLL